MKYAVLVYQDERIWTEATAEQRAAFHVAHGAFDEAVRRRARLLGGEALSGVADATTLRRDAAGAAVLTDGPFAETTEQLGGFYLVEAPDLDTMTELCSILPASYALEIRPVVDVSGTEDWLEAQGRLVTALDRVWRDEWGRVLALLVAQYRRLDLAEDALADAFEAAARTWPRDGVPANPPAWLLTAARRRVVDRLRAEAMTVRKQPMLVVEADVQQQAHAVLADPGGLVPDERLRLLLLCAHPSLAPEAAAALSLRLVLGVSTEDVARLFLTTTSTMAARITRAKKKLVTAGVPLAVPDEAALADRVGVVASIAYLAFTAGYAPGSGPDPVRVDLASDAVRLVRVSLELLPGRSRLRALLALMLLQHSRRDARVDRDGPEPAIVLLPDQDRDRWHHDEIAEGLLLLRGLLDEPPPADPATRELLLQAVIAAEHATAPTARDTRWDRIAATYAELEAVTGSAVVRLNRAVAVAEDRGPEAGLRLLDGLDDLLPVGHRLPATRAALLARAGRREAAVAAYDVAIDRCGNESEGRHLRRERDELSRPAP